MSEEETCVVRIVNLDETFTKETLKFLICTKCQPAGEIKSIHLKKDDELNLFYGYVVFEYSFDAVKVTQNLNGYVHTTNKFQAELIGPNLIYRTFSKKEQIPVEEYFCCRTCLGNHSSFLCPRRQSFGIRQNRWAARRFVDEVVVRKEVSTKGTAKDEHASKSWRDGSSYANIYISNISPSTTEADLAKLVEPFGPRKKIFLGMDKVTGRCKGFAYVNFKFRSDATEAIDKLNRTNFKDKILKVDWSKS